MPDHITVEELKSQLFPRSEETWAAFSGLGQCGCTDSLNLLLELASNDDWTYRRAAIEALSIHILGNAARKHVCRALVDTSEFVVRTACESAARMNISEARKDILELLKSSGHSTRMAALDALNSLWISSDFDAVFNMYMADKEERVRREAAFLLRSKASASTWESLFAAWVIDPLGRHRVWACELAGLFGDTKAKERILPLMADADGHVRKAARAALHNE